MPVEDDLALGQAALHDGRWAEARTRFESVLANLESPEALSGLAEASFWSGETRRSVDYRERAYSAFRHRDDPYGAADAAVWLCMSYASDLGNLPAARGWLERARRVAEETDSPVIDGWIHLMDGALGDDLERSRALVETALELARRTLEDGHADLELCALSELGVVLVQLGDVAEGLRCIDEAMAASLAREGTLLDTVIYTSCSMMTACILTADLGRVMHWCRVADDFTRAYGGPFLYAYCRTAYGRVLIGKGHWAEALQELQAARNTTRDAYPAMYRQSLVSLADLHLRRGEFETARGLLDDIDDPVEFALPLAELALHDGVPSLAVSLIERWLESSSDRSSGSAHALRGERTVEGITALGLLIRSHLAAGNAGASRAILLRLEQHPSALATAHVTLARGRIAAHEGSREAARHLEDAALRFSQLELPLEAARARMELTRVIALHDPGIAISEARAALSCFDRLGARADADEAAALLRSLGAAGRTGPRNTGLLTRREAEILALVADGLSNVEIAERLYISRKTASHHVSNLLGKLGVRNRAEAAAFAARRAQGVTPRP